MGIWKLGYVNSLDGAVDYTAGKVLHDKFGAAVMPLDATKMCRAVARVTSITGGGGNILNCGSITNYPNIADSTFDAAPTSFETDEFNYGFVRLLSGTAKNTVYGVDDTSTTALTTDTDLVTAGVAANDYLEVVTGSCTFEFPADRNPIRRDFKRVFKGSAMRFPFYEGGLVMPIGYEADDMVIMTYLTDERDADRLEVMLNHLLDYKGFDGMYSTGGSGVNSDGLAPMILETGTHDINHQYLVYVSDYKIVKDAKRSDDFWDVLIHLQDFTRPLYRGV